MGYWGGGQRAGAVASGQGQGQRAEGRRGGGGRARGGVQREGMIIFCEEDMRKYTKNKNILRHEHRKEPLIQTKHQFFIQTKGAVFWCAEVYSVYLFPV